MASTADADTVRRLIYGGSTRTGTLSTADVNWFVDNNPNVRLAASEAAMAEATLLASKPSRTVGDISIDYTGAINNYRSMSADLRKSGLRSVKPYAGGLTRSSKDTERDDSDRVPPAFAVGQFDNPRSSSTDAYWSGQQ